MNTKLLCAVAILALSGTAQAQPTDSFYLMRNTVSGKELCAQHPFSPDWTPRMGPYKDQNCTIANRSEAAKPAHLPASPLNLPKATVSEPQATLNPAAAAPSH